MNSNKNWTLQIKPKVYKILARFPKYIREHILVIIEKLSSNPYEGDIEKLGGEKNAWRRRIGAYRIFFEIFSDEKIIHVFRIERRSSKTY